MKPSSNSLDCSLQQTLQKGFLQLGLHPPFLSLPQAVFCFICIIAEPQPFPGAFFFLAMPCKMGAVDWAACAPERGRRDMSTGARSSGAVNAPSVCICDMQDGSSRFSTCMLNLSTRQATLIFGKHRRITRGRSQHNCPTSWGTVQRLTDSVQSLSHHI